jgi:hypothetical protein
LSCDPGFDLIKLIKYNFVTDVRRFPRPKVASTSAESHHRKRLAGSADRHDDANLKVRM